MKPGRPTPRSAIAGALSSAALALAPGIASADEPAAGPAIAAPLPDAVRPPEAEADARRQIDRTWLYLDDARIPAPLHVVALSNVTYTNVGSPTRIGSGAYHALGLNTAQPGAAVALGGEMGLFPHVSIATTVQIGFGGQGQLGSGVQVPSAGAGIVAGLRVSALPRAWESTHLVVSAGYLREAWQGPTYDEDARQWHPGKPYGDSGVWAQIAFSQDIQRLRLAATAHVEHVFADGRDPVDLMVQAGASFRVAGGFRLGAEYVGQDLEEAGIPNAEGGVRHVLGPTASLQLWRDRITIAAGPSFGLSHLSPLVMGRAAAAVGF
jgi:hypothetical protein